MGVISMILQTIEDRIKSLLLFLWSIIGEAVAWTQDEHALPQKLIRTGQITLAVMVFLVVLCIGGFIINNLLLKVIPASLIAITFYAFITIFQWVPRRFAKERDRKDMPWSTWQTMTKEQRDEWKHEYSREYALSMAVGGINGWLFWVVGILDLFILLEPWRAGNQLLVFGFLFLCWTFVHLFRFLGTLGITIKIIFAIILVLMFAVRLGMQTNNETALRIAIWSHFKQSQSQIQRAAKDVFTEENKKEAMLIPQQRIYQLRQGAELVDRNGDKVSLTDNVAIVWVPDDKDQPVQPSILLGVYKQAYLPQLGSRTIFQRDINREVWVNFSDISRQIDLKIEPKAQRQDDSDGRSVARNALTPPKKIDRPERIAGQLGSGSAERVGQYTPEPSQQPEHGGQIILTSSQELFDGGLELKDNAGVSISGPCQIYWHEGSVIWNKAKDATVWAWILPCGNYRFDASGRIKRFVGVGRFRYPKLPAYCVVVNQDDQISAWPKGDMIAVAEGVDKIVLKLNAPLKDEDWGSDQGSIVLEVVK